MALARVVSLVWSTYSSISMSGEDIYNKPLDSHPIGDHRQRPFARKTLPATLLCLAAVAIGGCVSLQDDLGAEAEPLPAMTASANATDVCRLPRAKAVSDAPIDPRLQPDALWQRLRAGFMLDDYHHPRVQHEIDRLLRNKIALRGLLQQARPYLQYITRQTQAHGLPMEIALLPAVESGFRPYAFSTDGATGLWQFMPSTGRHLGLTRNWWYDGRRDPIAATDAALTYLERLSKRFDGDWLHGLAAYNAGGGTISKAIRKNRKAGKPVDYWSLDLPGETDAYVPRLLALCAIIKDPQRFDIELPPIVDRPYFEVVETGDQLDLSVAAKLADISLEELLQLNPAFNRGATPPDGPHELLLPADAAEAFQAALDALPAEKRLRRTRYRVRPGDSLSTIAARHKLPVRAVMTANNLKKNLIRAGQDLVIPLSAAEAVPLSNYAKLPTSSLRYRVQHGDSLYTIARRYDVSIGDLRRWNRLESNLLRPGQRLTLYIDPTRKTL